MVTTIRVGVLGLLGLCGLWGCGGTVTHGDPDSSDSDASDSTDGTDGGFGDDSGSGTGGSGANDGAGGTGDVGGSDLTGSDGSGTAATTRGSGSRAASASSTSVNGGTASSTTGSSDDSSAAASASSGVGVTSGAGGQAATLSSAVTTVGTTGGPGSGGFGGDPSSNTATFSSVSVVTSTTGSGGTPPDGPPDLEDFPYLDGCESSYWNTSNQYCSLNFECPSQTGWASCWDYGNGEVACDCSRNYYYSNYRLSDVDMDEACGYTVSACVAGSDVETGPPKCTPASLYQSTTYCNATASCRTDLDVGGADIEKTASHYVYCEQRDDAWACDCDIADGRVTVTLDTSSGSADMCLDALDWCSGEITREGPRECAPSSQYAGTDSCYVNLRCTQAAVAGGVPASLTESYTVSCYHDEAGKWVCDCPGVGSIDVEAETGWDACTIGASECTPI